jgi:hypothetical protein
MTSDTDSLDGGQRAGTPRDGGSSRDNGERARSTQDGAQGGRQRDEQGGARG